MIVEIAIAVVIVVIVVAIDDDCSNARFQQAATLKQLDLEIL